LQNSLITTLLVLLYAIGVSASGAGALGGPYLRVPAGALTPINGTASPDYLSIAVNPSRLAFNQRKQLVVNAGLKPLGRKEGSLSWEYGISSKVAVGAAAFYRGDPSLDNLKTDNEADIEEASFTTLTTYLGGRLRLKRNISIGISGKFIYLNMPSDFNSRGELKYSNQFDLGGIDLGMSFDRSQKLKLGFNFKNLFGIIHWKLKNYNSDYTSQNNDTLSSPFTAGVRIKSTAGGHPFIWNPDISIYLINSFFSPLEHKFASINNGFIWKRWENFHILAGIENIILNYNLIKDQDSYKDEFHPVIRLGMYADLSSLIDTDLCIAYSISNDRVWAGVDQKLDLLFNF